MNKNLVPKSLFIVLLIAAAIWTLYPPSQTLKPGIDLAGGTSLIYAIDTQGLGAEGQRDLAQKMITVLRRRIDPANIQNLVWRPQGNTRFEIQMPLASKDTQDKRQEYETALNDLLARNVNAATIMRSLQQPLEQRAETSKKIAQDDPNRLKILENLATIHDERQALQQKRDGLYAKISDTEKKISEAGLKLDRIQENRRDWAKLNDEQLKNTLTDFLGSEEQTGLLTDYVRTQTELMGILSQLTDEAGLNDRYDEAKRELDRLNLTQDQIDYVLEMSASSPTRVTGIAKLKAEFPDRAAQIDRAVVAYDNYRQYQGRLDDPSDLRRMLKGAGILEFRILPTRDRTELSAAEIERYTQALTEKGPKYASDTSYVWVEIENMEEWHTLNSVVGKFGDKYYVLASNRPDEKMLHDATGRDWKLDNSYPTNDEMGRRAIGFHLDVKGGNLFWNITRKNGGRPLAILLDDIAISAPEINPERPIGQSGIIMGTFTQTQVADMVNKLNAGSLPARLIEQPISERVIGPSIGADNLAKGIRSGIIGLALVISFMIVYYFIGGSIADVALLLNLLFTLAIMAGIRSTFTLPGIAGFILTIGMSVDANVLIFERIREEQERGAGITTAIKNGYQRAFSAIFDSNLTTILTAAILYYVASEDVKGFAIVLMLGIGASMFTAIYVTRVVFDILISRRILKDRLMMLRLIRTPNIDWMGLRPAFYAISAVLVFGGLILFFARDKSKYDIELTGGTSVQINLKDDVSLTRQNVEDRVVQIGQQLKNSDLQTVSVYSVGEPKPGSSGSEKIYDQYEITTPATNTLQTTLTLSQGSEQTAEAVRAVVHKVVIQKAYDLGDIDVAAGGNRSFVVTTNRVNPTAMQAALKGAFPDAQVSESTVNEVVSDAVRKAFEGQLEIQQNLQPTITSTQKITNATVDTYPELADYVGGIKMDVGLSRPASLQEIDQRLKDLRFRPDTQDLAWYPYQIFGTDLKPLEPNQPASAFTFVSVQPEAGLRELTPDEWTQFTDNEKARVLQAAQRETSLPRVTQIDPFIGAEARTRAIISIVLSLAAIVAYIWIRFGTLRFGLAAIAALFHDVSTALGAIAASAFLAKTAIGQALLIGDFRINGTVIAAILTLLGYSLNDTIVVFDRIRENRRRVQLTPQSVTNSINQTLSRTLITGITTMMVVLVMYIFGGPGLRGFNFVIFLGLVVGTYSSVAIAAPLLLVRTGKDRESEKMAA
ncbi:MAG: protein translocase subunit SecD [Sedimentisphaerales bacterium]|nr:protein translocase subunit SecD [Sedimentisphaerales bacterium]